MVEGLNPFLAFFLLGGSKPSIRSAHIWGKMILSFLDQKDYFIGDHALEGPTANWVKILLLH